MSSRSIRIAPRKKHRGFTYLWVLVAIAVLGVGLLAVSEMWTTVVHRQKLEELEWSGAQIARAIGSYYETSPGTKAYPANMQDLLDDRRSLVIRRHLRANYPNPFSGKTEWEFMVEADGKFRGVRVKIIDTIGEPALREFIYQPMKMRKLQVNLVRAQALT